jgi:DNA-binding CsgD family transcriptional regulator
VLFGIPAPENRVLLPILKAQADLHIVLPCLEPSHRGRPTVALLADTSDYALLVKARRLADNLLLVVKATPPIYGELLLDLGISSVPWAIGPPQILSAVRSVSLGERFYSSPTGALMHRRSHPKLAALTPREREILDHLNKGRKIGEIAMRLGIGTETVRTHAARIRRKMGVSSNRELKGVLYGWNGQVLDT